MHRLHTITHTLDRHICREIDAAVMVCGSGLLPASLTPSRYGTFCAPDFNPGVSAYLHLLPGPASSSYADVPSEASEAGLKPLLEKSNKKDRVPNGRLTLLRISAPPVRRNGAATSIPPDRFSKLHSYEAAVLMVFQLLK
jgi:hypothetical protein